MFKFVENHNDSKKKEESNEKSILNDYDKNFLKTLEILQKKIEKTKKRISKVLIDDRFSMINKFISNFNDSISLFFSYKHNINQLLMINLNFHYRFSSCDFENSMNSIVSIFFAFIVLSTTNSTTTFNEINQHLLHNNVTCYANFKKKFAHMICVDINSNFFLMSKFCLQQSYSNLFIYSMTNQKKLKCIEIEIEFVITNKCVNVSMRLRKKTNNYVEIVTQIHVISQFKCDMIFEISTVTI